MPLEEYRRNTLGLSGRGVVILCVASFCTGIVVGTMQVSDGGNVREPVPVIQSVEPTIPIDNPM